MDTLICPKGHINIENRLWSNVNRGLRCLTCEDVMVCDGCGYKVTRTIGRRGLEWPGVYWIGSMELAELGIIKQGNPRDGGVYGLCPSCKQSTLHIDGRTSWYDLEAFERDGGKRFRLDVRPYADPCFGYVLADAELVLLCDTHAEGYRRAFPHTMWKIGTPEAGADARCTMCWPSPTVGGVVISGAVLIDGKPYYSYVQVLAEMERRQMSAGLPSDAEQHRAMAAYYAAERATYERERRYPGTYTHEPGGPVRPDGPEHDPPRTGDA